MTAKEYLRQLHILDIKIQRLRVEYEDLTCRTGALSEIRGIESEVGEVVSKADKIGRRLAKRSGEYNACREKIVRQILDLEDTRYSDILLLRYVDGKRLEDIACIMQKSNGAPYSYEHILHLHGQALQAFEKKYLKSHSNHI